VLDAPWSNEVMLQWLQSVLQSRREGQGLGEGASEAAGAEAHVLEQAGVK